MMKINITISGPESKVNGNGLVYIMKSIDSDCPTDSSTFQVTLKVLGNFPAVIQTIVHFVVFTKPNR